MHNFFPIYVIGHDILDAHHTAAAMELLLQSLYLFPAADIAEEVLDDVSALANQYECKSLRRR